MFELTVKRSFSAAHKLRGYGGKCEHLHGHNWTVEVVVWAHELNELGLAVDFGDLQQLTDDVLQKLDHKFLNEVAPFGELNPSSENIGRWIFEALKEKLGDGPVSLHQVSVWENPNCCATYRE